MKTSLRTMVVCALLAVLGCGPQNSDPGTDSSTQFWKLCDTGDQCGGLSCICGRCTKVCGLDEECSAFPRTPLCALLTEVSDCSVSDPQNVCAPEDALMISGEQETATE